MKVITLTGLRGTESAGEGTAAGMNKYAKLALWTVGGVVGVTLIGMVLSGKVRRGRRKSGRKHR